MRNTRWIPKWLRDYQRAVDALNAKEDTRPDPNATQRAIAALRPTPRTDG